ncbi:MAG TPA: pyridoxal-phosphate dependent enzyme [Bacteroidales bacterium]|nr:pyridoxal-phosphate dependent enzyme [Bacteroidales bacterium]
MLELINNTYNAIKQEIICTPLLLCNTIPGLEQLDLYLKLENSQETGSFKYRGALSKLYQMSKEGIDTKGLVLSSTGNHAAAVIHALSRNRCNIVLFVPETISESKLEHLRTFDAILKIEGENSAETEALAQQYAYENSLPFIHPYNDKYIIAGQGTIGIELIKQLPGLDAVFIPVGGGGLISGIASYLKQINSSINIIGCQPELAPEMALSVKRGEIIPPFNRATLADGVAGGLDPNTITLPICKSLVDEFVLLSEEEIKHAVYLVYHHMQMIVEPAAVLSVAAVIKKKDFFNGKKLVAIISGKRISESLFKQIVKDHESDNQ